MKARIQHRWRLDPAPAAWPPATAPGTAPGTAVARAAAAAAAAPAARAHRKAFPEAPKTSEKGKAPVKRAKPWRSSAVFIRKESP